MHALRSGSAGFGSGGAGLRLPGAPTFQAACAPSLKCSSDRALASPLDLVLDAITVLTPQLIDEGHVGIEPGAPRGRPLGSVEVLVRRHYLRSDLKPARSSSERNFGCSQAAKWPPLGSLL